LCAVTAELGHKARISFRLNTDVDPDTHRHIATSHKTTKFGILSENGELIEAYRRARQDPLLEVCGIHSHIGSQITDGASFLKNVALMTHAVSRLKRELGLELSFINIGGGFGLPYRPDQQPLNAEKLASELCGRLLADLDYQPEIWLEPGRWFVGDAGVLVSRINSVKMTPYKNFINVDTGFNHLVRPVLYEAYHQVRLLADGGEPRCFDVAGNICETGDILAEDRTLATPAAGDCLAFLDVGAYGFSMASEFNMFPLPAEVLVRGDEATLIRERATMQDLMRNQILLDDLR
jgi:diaminopimelate decarboxylase